MDANAPCTEIVAVTRPTRPYWSPVNIRARPASEQTAETIAQAHAPALASGTPWISAIGSTTTSPTRKTQASALGPPSARETFASSTEMLPHVTAVTVARRTPISIASARRRDQRDTRQESSDARQLAAGEALPEHEERDHHADHGRLRGQHGRHRDAARAGRDEEREV